MSRFRASLRQAPCRWLRSWCCVLIPKLGVHIPILFQNDLNSPGTLQLLALMSDLRGARVHL